MRIGLHTGPVIAGVQTFGNKMPRYRLFGNSVNLASSLNALGEGKFGCKGWLFFNYRQRRSVRTCSGYRFSGKDPLIPQPFLVAAHPCLEIFADLFTVLILAKATVQARIFLAETTVF